MFQFRCFDSCEGLVYFLDYYHERTQPDSKDEYGNPIWNEAHYTNIGNVLHSYKCNKDLTKIESLSNAFIENFYNEFRDGQNIDLIIPVPSNSDTLHISRVAKRISHNLNITYAEVLRKNTNVQQKGLHDSERKRQKNFIVTDETTLKCKNVLLIDDIVKTGATIQNCISTLKSLNSEVQIIAFAFCSGMV